MIALPLWRAVVGAFSQKSAYSDSFRISIYEELREDSLIGRRRGTIFSLVDIRSEKVSSLPRLTQQIQRGVRTWA